MSHPIYSTESFPTAPRRSNGVAVFGTNTFYSGIWKATKSDGFGLHLEWTGTPTGTFTLWRASKSYQDGKGPNEANDNDWVQETTFSPSNPAGAAGKMADEVSNGRNEFWRVKYVNASGTGTLFGWVTLEDD